MYQIYVKCANCGRFRDSYRIESKFCGHGCRKEYREKERPYVKTFLDTLSTEQIKMLDEILDRQREVSDYDDTILDEEIVKILKED